MTNTTNFSTPAPTSPRDQDTMLPQSNHLSPPTPPSSNNNHFAQKVEKVAVTVENKIQEFNNSVGGSDERTKAKELKTCLILAREHIQELKKKNQTHIPELNEAAKELREIIMMIDEMNQTESYYQIALRTQESVSSTMKNFISVAAEQWGSFSQFASSAYQNITELLPSWKKNA